MDPFKHLDFFSASEFVTNNGTDWSQDMAIKTLFKLDALRSLRGFPFWISRHDRALGRRLGPTDTSAHNIDKWGSVLAVDGFPADMRTRSDARLWVAAAKNIGFTGIGVYPDWHQGPGLHLDTRPTEQPGAPATWGFVLDSKGRYTQVSLDEAIRRWRTRK